MTLATLKRKASLAATARGHQLNRWTTTKTYALTVCRRCGLPVAVNTQPKPNEIDIGGPVVAINCGGINAALEAVGAIARD